MNSKQSGFTLIEVLVALTLATLGILSVTLPAITATRNAVSLREQSLAHWVAMNHASDLRLAAQWPDTGRSDGDVEFAGRDWRWETEVLETDVAGLRRADIDVAHADEPDKIVASVVAFIGEPTPGIQFRPWTGIPLPAGPGNRPRGSGRDQ